ncbi:hypothetical protein OS493_000748 [Desmophyllum pertusum]|uniref:Uncharacterized protein n=1 Tax=Desmophyllum pertusum TaxID=174260 RepID=A0A9X0A7M2_9CNID|nr:hypothetical protein OS493_000748 [Desmophyllum pertusum]
MYSEHYRALSEIVFALNSMVLKAVVGQQFPLSRSEAGGIVTNDMSAEGIGKVRYCGAWAIAKERYRCQDYFRSSSQKQAKEAYASQEGTWSSGTAKQKSQYQDTLNVTLSRTYDKGQLVHITDPCLSGVLN